MNFLYSLPTLVNPGGTEDGELKSGLSIADVTPGLLGFLATLFLVLVVIFLIRDMVKRIRRVRYREQALTGVGTDVFIPASEDLRHGGPSAPAEAAATEDGRGPGTGERG